MPGWFVGQMNQPHVEYCDEAPRMEIEEACMESKRMPNMLLCKLAPKDMLIPLQLFGDPG